MNFWALLTLAGWIAAVAILWLLAGLVEWLMRPIDRNPHGQPEPKWKEGLDD